MKKKLLIIVLSILGPAHINAQLNSSFYLNTGSWTIANNLSIGLAKDLGAVAAGNGVKIVWRSIQDSTNTPYIWTSLDQTVKALQDSSLDMFAYILCINPKSLAGSPTGCGNISGCSGDYDTTGLNGGQSWFPEDTVQWKLFLDALINRYDTASAGPHPPWLNFSINKWRIETEWQSFWCSEYCDTSIAVANEFSNYVNLTYREIRLKQPSAIISFAGMDPIHDKTIFADGYTSDTSYCINQTCTGGGQILETQTQMQTVDISFRAKRRNMLYILRNTQFDELDIHQYGRWQHIPNTIQWLKDSAYTGSRPIDFLEGAGPYCFFCEQIYHPGTDTTGVLPTALVRDNSSYVVYWHIMGLANNVKRLAWYRITPDYNNSGTSFGDFCLLSINYIKKPSYYTYRFLAKNIFANANADSVVQVNESDTSIYHFRIAPLDLHVIWSTNSSSSYTVNGNGTLYRWDIPTTCESTMPTYCDSIVQNSSINVVGSTTISLIDGVPVFYSWNNSIGIPDIADNQNQVKVYPNPTTGDFTVSIFVDVPQLLKYELFDLTGKKILETNKTISPGNGNTLINTSNLSSGIYLLFVSGEGEFYQQKIIKY